MKPHKHKDMIIAWANGEEIQIYSKISKCWMPVSDVPYWEKDYEYRIKPEPKTDHIYYGMFVMDGSGVLGSAFTKIQDKGDELKLTFDGETGKLKAAEVLK